MNYLAHLYLAEDSPESLLGNLLGDFVKGSAINGYSEAIKRGIILHRKIDAYTDAHPVAIASKQSIGAINKRYAGIIIDIFYDHFLASQWDKYSCVPLESFAEKIYQVLEDYQEILPAALQRATPKIVAGNWLVSYANIDYIDVVLNRTSKRIKRQNSLGSAVSDLIANYDLLSMHFHSFFPDLIDFSNKSRS
jgi:acyl carrier protein phosphodiesterase